MNNCHVRLNFWMKPNKTTGTKTKTSASASVSSQQADKRIDRPMDGRTDGHQHVQHVSLFVLITHECVTQSIFGCIVMYACVCVCVWSRVAPDSLEIVSLHNGQHNQWVHSKYKSLDLCINKNCPSVQVSCISVFFLWHFLRKVRVNMTNLRPPTHQKNLCSFQKTFLKSGNKPTKKNRSI